MDNVYFLPLLDRLRSDETPVTRNDVLESIKNEVKYALNHWSVPMPRTGSVYAVTKWEHDIIRAVSKHETRLEQIRAKALVSAINPLVQISGKLIFDNSIVVIDITIEG